MIDAATLQAFAAVCAMLLAGLVAICGWVYWHISGMERRMNARMDRMTEQMERMEERSTDRMERMEQRLTERIDQQHREVLSLLEGHIHADGSPAVFRRVTPAADG